MADAKAGGPGDRLTAIMDEVLAFRDARDWRQFHAPKELASALGIEAGELQELFLWRGIETAAAVAAELQQRADLRIGRGAVVERFARLHGGDAVPEQPFQAPERGGESVRHAVSP